MKKKKLKKLWYEELSEWIGKLFICVLCLILNMINVIFLKNPLLTYFCLGITFSILIQLLFREVTRLHNLRALKRLKELLEEDIEVI